MKISSNWQKKVDNYLQGTLDKVSFEALEKELKSNKDFNTYFEKRRDETIKKGVKYAVKREALKKKITQIQLEIEDQKDDKNEVGTNSLRSIMSNRKWLGIAAAFLIFGIFGWLFMDCLLYLMEKIKKLLSFCLFLISTWCFGN